MWIIIVRRRLTENNNDDDNNSTYYTNDNKHDYSNTVDHLIDSIFVTNINNHSIVLKHGNRNDEP